ncbi:bifunctional hydroxymethylpyrimidine kinase/phosphomethylpyrimidine kinase [Corynebacterium diphtheriae]|uniref:bifunctional hydroxymethylpyrimidine kinase/phosphomethylpyrimidine kinase n=1 Tax=Corynebacterium diphtheriae TaxID=1717 RepID=UPI0024BD43C0|nr:bifunctional hydroxymethylpyrimidine kinase/phosphomethylpyrimidine kinase [Corynebacterium diphtheriae]
MTPHILTIAGSDPSGGAGIQADLKSIMAVGGYGMAAITALTAQNTCGVTAIHTPPTEFLSQQLRAISDDITIHAIKIGMIGSAEAATAIATWLDQLHHTPIVVLDPVMVATSGSVLGERHYFEPLLRHATVITPNLPELAVLTNNHDPEQTEHAAHSLAEQYDCAVLLKGGHRHGTNDLGNTWITASGPQFHAPSPRIHTTNTHGTGCSLSSALATRLAIEPPEPALHWATTWLNGAIAHGSDLNVGHGNGPVDHSYRLGEYSANCNTHPKNSRRATFNMAPQL